MLVASNEQASGFDARPAGSPAEAGQSTNASVTPILDVRGLSISFRGRDGITHVTRDVSFTVAPGERVGVVGESGCGKSVTGLSLLRLLPERTAIIDGEIRFDGRDLMSMRPKEVRAIRGRDISMIFQEPMTALDPVFTVGQQLVETLRTHYPVPPAEARERAIQALKDVGIPSPETRVDEYPHQFSGGMRQRVMIAMALICKPKLIIADEPTTALDVTVQAQIIDLLTELSENTGAALLFITHDLGVVAETCSRMITMYAGEVVETSPVDDVLRRPGHPYTSGLLRSLPRLSDRGGRLPFIPGRVPSPNAMPEGCRFQARCPHASEGCERYQTMTEIDRQRHARCHKATQLKLEGAV
ncbi:peptide/nickel transport system ATP-binding protein [Marinobacter segnicrescens]|uniref:ABC-type dipeptide transporter n=1 Tax=Marinobacter segnicrescens TaxID=430453 RepID=A0A1I0A883_9GAMM|nr:MULTISPECIES: ABC transporter ATP-binding protein [Marinobacter]UZD66087.1 ABC transporter ATP-binding protein [Marinobacter sp. AN1]SES90201.1 peptide/nickel transport system ATP-binding protein [Marinobacter segnicrescens]